MHCGNCWKAMVPFGAALILGITSVSVFVSSKDNLNVYGIVVSRQPNFTKKPFPKMTNEARINKVEGIISLKVTFNELGKCENVEVLQGLPFGLTESAIEAAKHTEIAPYRFLENHVSISTTIKYKINQSN